MTAASPPTLRSFLGAAASPFILSGACAALCYALSGPSLNLYIGSILFATLIAPALTLAEPTPMRQFIAAGSVVDGVGLVWLVAALQSATTLWQWLMCYVLLACYVAAIGALAVLLVRMKFNRIPASAIVVILGLAWLTWPVWLSPWLDERMASWLVPAHPLLAINGELVHLGVWGEQTVAYRLTNLGQHVSYRLPSGVGFASLVHLLIASAILALLVWWEAPREPSDRPATPSLPPAPPGSDTP